MNIKILILTGLLCTSVCVQSCKSTSKTRSSENTSTKPLTISLKDDGKTFRLNVNDKFDVTLNQCVGCADFWKISEIDSTKIGFLAEAYSNRSCIDCVGGNQDKTFQFEVISAGRSTITFNYFNENISVIIDGI